MQIFGIFGKLPRPPVGQDEEDGRAEKAAAEDDHLAFEERLANALSWDVEFCQPQTTHANG